MAWIKPYRYWDIMSNPDYYAYQLEENGPVYKIYDANRGSLSRLVSGPGAHTTEETTVEKMQKLKAYSEYENYARYVEVGVPLAWCIAKKRGLDILRDEYDRTVAATYQHCGNSKKN